MLEAIAITVVIFALPFMSNHPLLAVSGGMLIILTFPGIYAFVTGPPFKPTSKEKIAAAITLGKIQPGQTIYDLGCGDGRLLRAAAAKGACAIGYELSLPMYLFAKIQCSFSPNIHVRFGDFWKNSYSDADLVYCFLVPSVMERFSREIWPRLPTGCKVLSNAFSIPGLQSVGESKGILLFEKKEPILQNDSEDRARIPYRMDHSEAGRVLGLSNHQEHATPVA